MQTDVLWLTFDLDVLQQHWFHHLPSNQDPGGPPVQDVCPRLETHLKADLKAAHGDGGGASDWWKSRTIVIVVVTFITNSLCVCPILRCW